MPEQNTSGHIPQPSQTGLTKLEGEISLEGEVQLGVEDVVPVFKEEPGSGNTSLSDEMNKSVQPSKPEIEAITPQASADTPSESPGLG